MDSSRVRAWEKGAVWWMRKGSSRTEQEQEAPCLLTQCVHCNLRRALARSEHQRQAVQSHSPTRPLRVPPPARARSVDSQDSPRPCSKTTSTLFHVQCTPIPSDVAATSSVTWHNRCSNPHFVTESLSRSARSTSLSSKTNSHSPRWGGCTSFEAPSGSPTNPTHFLSTAHQPFLGSPNPRNAFVQTLQGKQ